MLFLESDAEHEMHSKVDGLYTKMCNCIFNLFSIASAVPFLYRFNCITSEIIALQWKIG